MKVFANRTPRLGDADWRRDFAASLVVFLVALPLCMGIAIASDVPVAAGLVTGIIGGIVVGSLAGSPLQVSGPAAGLTVIVFELVRTHGLESLGIVVLIAGVIQVVAGWFKVGQWFRAVSPAVVEGMLAGIGILIIANQIHVMVDDTPRGSAVANIASIPEAIRKGLPLPTLGTREQRLAHANLLRQFGTLHSDQNQIAEQVAEVVPHDAPAEVAAEAHPELKEIVPDQERVLERLQAIQQDFLENDAWRQANGDYDDIRVLIGNAVAELSATLEDLRSATGAEVRQSQDVAAESLHAVELRLKNHDWAAKLGLITIAILIVWSILPSVLRTMPAPVVAIVATTGIAVVLSLPVLYVEIPDNLLNDLHAPSWTVLEQLDWGGILLSAVVVASVASAETLLCCSAVDQLQDRVKTDYDQELFAQGVGNVTCGMFGALPMTGVIVRSSANVRSGATSRMSAILHGVWLLAFAWQLSPLLRMIPTSSLAAMLVYTGFRLVNFKAIRELWRVGKGEVFVFVVTTSVIVIEDLLTGVLAGIVVSAIRLLLTFTKFDAELVSTGEAGTHELQFHGAGTFLRLPKLTKVLDRIPQGERVVFDVDALTYLDHACQHILLSWMRQYVKAGGEVKVPWEHLRVRGHLRETTIEEFRAAAGYSSPNSSATTKRPQSSSEGPTPPSQETISVSGDTGVGGSR